MCQLALLLLGPVQIRGLLAEQLGTDMEPHKKLIKVMRHEDVCTPEHQLGVSEALVDISTKAAASNYGCS